jgi:hypothetical protein
MKLFYYGGKFIGVEPAASRELIFLRQPITFADSPTMNTWGKGLYPRKFGSRFDEGQGTYVFTWSDWIAVE